MAVNAREVNFDGLVGPTHNYAGMAPGNLLSMRHAGSMSSPRRAVKQGLAKMRFVRDLGIPQCVIPPQPRPDVGVLRRLGFHGSDAEVLSRVTSESPSLMSAAMSASCMWTANAATVCPSLDSRDGRMHVTPANLQTLFHRSIEAHFTYDYFRNVFADASKFAVHEPLPGGESFSDEGAANHTRFDSHAGGVHLFVYGRRAIVSSDDRESGPEPTKFVARQTLEASQAVARLHRLDPDRTVFAQQNPAAIDGGVFHNDVIAVGNGNVLLYHEDAFVDSASVLDRLSGLVDGFCPVCVGRDELTIDEASASYLFNSQLLTPDPDRASMVLLAPTDAEEHPRARAAIEKVVAGDNPIDKATFIDVRESMRNGGGPACLRLRVLLTQAERESMHRGVVLTDALSDELDAWADRNYRESLTPGDLADPTLAQESARAMDELYTILDLGGMNNPRA